ncbi:CBS domain-containing protein [Desulfurobacterium indicum]|uniref:Signal transduction protein n=1 Tax=Desulfurobacterium indicum TaxID=1914305 RepID=A0A1R1ML23_9BACT|nr:CBS domain-containing protein [Desulfurobacterium indicum]OMH40466.1 signal transduction protein [Desulfurobacterium indicum]
MPIRDIMIRKVITVDIEDSIEYAVKKLEEKNVGSLVVMDGDKPVGIVTDRDIAIRGLGKSPDTPIKSIMTPELITVTSDSDFFKLTKKFRDFGVRRIVIVDKKGRLEGIISIDDVLEVLVTEFANLIGAIRS